MTKKKINNANEEIGEDNSDMINSLDSADH